MALPKFIDVNYKWGSCEYCTYGAHSICNDCSKEGYRDVINGFSDTLTEVFNVNFGKELNITLKGSYGVFEFQTDRYDCKIELNIYYESDHKGYVSWLSGVNIEFMSEYDNEFVKLKDDSLSKFGQVVKENHLKYYPDDSPDDQNDN